MTRRRGRRSSGAWRTPRSNAPFRGGKSKQERMLHPNTHTHANYKYPHHGPSASSVHGPRYGDDTAFYSALSGVIIFASHFLIVMHVLVTDHCSRDERPLVIVQHFHCLHLRFGRREVAWSVRSEKADQLILQIWSIDASCGDLDCEFPILWAAVPETGWSRSSVIEERARRTRRDAVQAPGVLWEHIKIRRQRRPRTLSDDDYLPQIYS